MLAIGRFWPSDDDDDADDANLHVTVLLFDCNANDDDGDDKDDDDNDKANLHVTVLLLEHGALPLGRQQEGQEPRHGKAGDEIVGFLCLSS